MRCMTTSHSAEWDTPMKQPVIAKQCAHWCGNLLLVWGHSLSGMGQGERGRVMTLPYRTVRFFAGATTGRPPCRKSTGEKTKQEPQNDGSCLDISGEITCSSADHGSRSAGLPRRWEREGPGARRVLLLPSSCQFRSACSDPLQGRIPPVPESES